MPSRAAIVLLAGCALLVPALLLAAPARADVVWLCKPGVQPDPCAESQQTTVQAADGSTTVVDPGNPADPPIDCFYVYPTVSEQLGTNADKAKDPQEIEIARYQAARYSQRCKVYAPMYRQLTLGSIYTGTPDARAAGRKIAYADVREAWLDYLAHDNHGRGVVLIGHSQGTGMLRQLMRDEVDPKPEVRKLLVSGILLGGNVAVKRGTKIGGDFQHIPGCTAPDQTGCVIAFSTFAEPPPDNTRFGRVPATDITGAGLPAGDAYEVLCTNPASLGANERKPVTSILRSEPFPGLIGAVLIVMYGGPPPTAPTPWLIPNERYTVRCEKSNGANVLMAQSIGSARKLNGAPTPDWGLHLADANLPLGELVDLVGSQGAAFVKAAGTPPQPRLSLRARCTRGGVVVAAGGADRGLIKRLDVIIGKRRVARDTKAPFARVVRRTTRATLTAVLKDGRRISVTRRLRGCG